MSAQPETRAGARAARRAGRGPRDAKGSAFTALLADGGNRLAVVQQWRLWLVAALTLTAVLCCYRLTAEGLGNPFYAATVRSMLVSPRNFFFVAFDPGGFLAIDKPPLGLWLQAASAAVFGFSGLSLLLPQALAGITGVGVLGWLVARVHGGPAGVLAALALATTPVWVAAARNNTADVPLVLVLLLAAAAAFKATEGRYGPRWLLLSFALVGVGFNVKMLQAYLVLPALAAVYLAGGQRASWPRRLAYLAAATVVLLVVSTIWVVVVDSVPAADRPYVGSSSTNSELDLALDYNGIGRVATGVRQVVFGNQPGPLGAKLPGQPGAPTNVWAWEIGVPGPLRLLGPQLGGQASWLAPVALVGFVLAAVATGTGRGEDGRFWSRQRLSLLLWLAWLLPQALLFSVSEFFHRYYLSTLAPGVAALAGIGGVALWQAYSAGTGWRRWLLPVTLVLGAGVQVWLLAPFGGLREALTPLVAGGALLAAVWLVAAQSVSRAARGAFRPGLAALLGLTALLLAPTVWAALPVLAGTSAELPHGGPPDPNAPGGVGMSDLSPGVISFLVAQRGDAPYLAATFDSGLSYQLILATGQPVMTLTGIVGQERILTPDQLAHAIDTGQVRYVLGSPFDFAQAPDQLAARDPFADLVLLVKDRCPPAAAPPATMRLGNQVVGVAVLGPCRRTGA